MASCPDEHGRAARCSAAVCFQRSLPTTWPGPGPGMRTSSASPLARKRLRRCSSVAARTVCSCCSLPLAPGRPSTSSRPGSSRTLRLRSRSCVPGALSSRSTTSRAFARWMGLRSPPSVRRPGSKTAKATCSPLLNSITALVGVDDGGDRFAKELEAVLGEGDGRRGVGQPVEIADAPKVAEPVSKMAATAAPAPAARLTPTAARRG